MREVREENLCICIVKRIGIVEGIITIFLVARHSIGKLEVTIGYEALMITMHSTIITTTRVVTFRHTSDHFELLSTMVTLVFVNRNVTHLLR